MSKIKKNKDTGAYEIDVKLDWSDLMLIKEALKRYTEDDMVRTHIKIDTKLNELNQELAKV